MKAEIKLFKIKCSGCDRELILHKIKADMKAIEVEINKRDWTWIRKVVTCPNCAKNKG